MSYSQDLTLARFGSEVLSPAASLPRYSFLCRNKYLLLSEKYSYECIELIKIISFPQRCLDQQPIPGAVGTHTENFKVNRDIHGVSQSCSTPH